MGVCRYFYYYIITPARKITQPATFFAQQYNNHKLIIRLLINLKDKFK